MQHELCNYQDIAIDKFRHSQQAGMNEIALSPQFDDGRSFSMDSPAESDISVATFRVCFVSSGFSDPAKFGLSLALADTSKLSLLFFLLPVVELVLLLVIDSLLQLLILQQQLPAPPELTGMYHMLLLADVLFVALSLLLYVFGPWQSKESTPQTQLPEQATPQGNTTVVRGGTARNVKALATSAEGIVPQDDEGELLAKFLSDKKPTTREAGRHNTVEVSSEALLEHILLSLATIFLKQESEPSDGLIHDGRDEERFPTQVRMKEESQPCKSAADIAEKIGNQIRFTDALNEASGSSHRAHYDQDGSSPLRVSPLERTKRRTDAQRALQAAKASEKSDMSTSGRLSCPQTSVDAPSTVEGKPPTYEGTEVPSLTVKPLFLVRTAAPLTEDSVREIAAISTPSAQHYKAQMDVARKGLLTYLREQTTKANEERAQRARQANGASNAGGNGSRQMKGAPGTPAGISSVSAGMAPQAEPLQSNSNGVMVVDITDGGKVGEEVCAALASLVGRPPPSRKRASVDSSISSTVASTLYNSQGIHPSESIYERAVDPLANRALSGQPSLAVLERQQQTQKLEEPLDTTLMRSDRGDHGRRVPLCKRSTKVLTVPLEPGLPVVVQAPPSSDSEKEGRTTPVGSREIKYGVSQPLRNRGYEDGEGSPMQRPAALDPFAVPSAPGRFPPSVFWGRSGAIGCNGTPMLSPRVNAGPSIAPQRRAVDDIGVQRRTTLPFGVERHFQRSPHVLFREVDGNWMKEGTAVRDSLGKGEYMYTGSKRFFGTPSLPNRICKDQEQQPGTMRGDIEKFRALAMKRRGKCKDSTTLEPLKEKLSSHDSSRLQNTAAWNELIPGEAGDTNVGTPVERGGDAAPSAPNACQCCDGGIVEEPSFSRQGAVGASGTPVVVLRALEPEGGTPQNVRRDLPGLLSNATDTPAGLQQPHGTPHAEGEQHLFRGYLHPLRNSSRRREGGDPLPHAANGGTPMFLTMQELLHPSDRFQRSEGAAMGDT
ncbi:hypothetical protein cyc_01495 [Cyclospora cayetanensis]|uniref:Transmembrane protein n=1 Tax=Cyclospora cayetanensis TaxID=88456 RepID=A0A1D3D6X2_9EIME|nr:hypothetical protein cyc_01495 [Cyclospora cayetanensis]